MGPDGTFIRLCLLRGVYRETISLRRTRTIDGKYITTDSGTPVARPGSAVMQGRELVVPTMDVISEEPTSPARLKGQWNWSNME